MNPIMKVVQAQIRILQERSNSVDAIEHNVTKGTLRETYLIDFFRSLIPEMFSITSGVVCDAGGRSSSQTDFIIAANNMLPSMLMMADVSVVPVESVHLIAEIKTTLRTTDLDQVRRSRDTFNNLKLTSFSGSSPTPTKIPSVILAFNNEVSKETLINWMGENQDTVAICIIGKFSLAKTIMGIECYESLELHPEHWETLAFIVQLYKWLQESSAKSRGVGMWDAYLQESNTSEGVGNDPC